MSEPVEVTAQSATVATTTSSQSATIDSKMMDLIAVRGRDPMSIFKTLPGVPIIADRDTWGDGFQSTVPTFQGRGGNTVYTDGVNGGDGGGGGNFSGITSIDAIAEVNVQANSYTAEYGFKGGAQVNLITKHGGVEFHGTAAWYKRHEQFNAQNFFNNRTGTAKPRYRYSGLLRHHRRPRTGQDPDPEQGWQAVQLLLFGGRHAAERSQAAPVFHHADGARKRRQISRRPEHPPAAPSVSGSAHAHTIRRTTSFPPPGATSRAGRLMNMLPLPNTSRRLGLQLHVAGAEPRPPAPRQLFRWDLRPTDKDTISIKQQTLVHRRCRLGGGRRLPSRWGLVRQRYDFTADQGKWIGPTIITPHLVNEASIGIFYSTEGGPPEDDLALASIQRDKDRAAALGDCAPDPKRCPATGTIKTGGPLAGTPADCPRQQPART